MLNDNIDKNVSNIYRMTIFQVNIIYIWRVDNAHTKKQLVKTLGFYCIRFAVS